MTTDLTLYEQQKADRWQFAKALAHSDLCPQHLRGKVADVAIICDQAKTLGVDGRTALDNLFCVHGVTAYSAKFLIGLANKNGQFDGPLRYRFEGAGWNCAVTCYAKLRDGEIVEGPTVDREMVERCGWDKNKQHKQLPEQLRAYRAATLFIRLYAPETTMGLQTIEEVQDVRYATATVVEAEPSAVAELAAAMRGETKAEPVSESEAPEPIVTTATVVEPDLGEYGDSNPFAGWTDTVKEDPA